VVHRLEPDLEYGLSAPAVSWSGYVTNLLADAGVHLPAAFTGAPIGKGPDGGLVATGAIERAGCARSLR
jgi:hypothetical protein